MATPNTLLDKLVIVPSLVAACGCGTGFTLEAWKALRPVTHAPERGRMVEKRMCACGQVLWVVLSKPNEEVARLRDYTGHLNREMEVAQAEVERLNKVVAAQDAELRQLKAGKGKPAANQEPGRLLVLDPADPRFTTLPRRAGSGR